MKAFGRLLFVLVLLTAPIFPLGCNNGGGSDDNNAGIPEGVEDPALEPLDDEGAPGSNKAEPEATPGSTKAEHEGGSGSTKAP